MFLIRSMGGLNLNKTWYGCLGLTAGCEIGKVIFEPSFMYRIVPIAFLFMIRYLQSKFQYNALRVTI